MRYHLMAVASTLFSVAGCGTGPEVKTSVAPDAGETGMHTFALMAPVYLGGRPIGANNPLLISSTTDDALHKDIVNLLTDRGYVQADSDPDLLVVYYLSPRHGGDPSDWDYGYTWRPSWLKGEGPAAINLTPAEYDDGAVIIDVLDAHTGQRLWRGHGVADTPDDERQYDRNLSQTVTAILDRLPESSVASK